MRIQKVHLMLNTEINMTLNANALEFNDLRKNQGILYVLKLWIKIDYIPMKA